MKKHIANIVTLLNLASGMTSIYLSTLGMFVESAIMILIAVFFDFIDGRVARMLSVESDIGAELDSLSDLVSFGVAPAILVYNQFPQILIMILGILFVMSGAYRLARFNSIRKEIKGFVGMPITINGFIFPILFFASATLNIYYAVLLVSTFMMISTLRFKKI